MTDKPDTLDTELAAFRRLEADLARAVAACQAAHDRGEIGFEQYRAVRALQERLLAAGTALSTRIGEALETLVSTGAAWDNGRTDATR